MTTPSSEILDRLPPQDLAAEKAVLGCIMLKSDVVDELGSILRPEDFYAEAHSKLYATLLRMHEAGKRIDSVLLANQLKADGNFEAVGGAAYVVEVMNSVPHHLHFRHYADAIIDRSRRRALIHASTEILRNAWDAGEPTVEVVNRAEAALAAIRTGEQDTEPVELSAAMQDLVVRVDAAQQRQGHVGVLTGLEAFDEQIGGLHPGDLVILAARTSVGKTSLALAWAYHSACAGRRVLFISLEMSRVELANKIAAGLAGVSAHQVRAGKLSREEECRLSEAIAEAAEKPLVISDRLGQSVADIRRAARRLMKKDLRLLVVDYLGFVRPEDKRIQRYEQVGQIVAGLKSVARELDVPVLVLAQLNRQADEAERPRLSHLRESGAIEQDADVVLLLHRPEGGISTKDGPRWDAELAVAKNRMGPTPTYRLTWDGRSTAFSPYEAHRF